MKRLLLTICILAMSISTNALTLPNKIECINDKGDVFIIDRLKKVLILPSSSHAPSSHKYIEDKNNIFISENFINLDGVNIRVAIGLLEKNGFIVGGISGYNNVTKERVFDMIPLMCKN